MRFAAICLCLAGLVLTAHTRAEPNPSHTELAPEPTRAEQTESKETPLARATFSTRIEEREPTDPIDQLTTAYDQVFFFTEVVGLEGSEIVHRWEYGGKLMAEVPFAIQGPRWRVYSSKNLSSAWTGTWTVTVVGSGGQILAQRSLEYISAEPAAADLEQVTEDFEP